MDRHRRCALDSPSLAPAACGWSLQMGWWQWQMLRPRCGSMLGTHGEAPGAVGHLLTSVCKRRRRGWVVKRPGDLGSGPVLRLRQVLS